ncbi:MAG TPA: hypothetical protein PKE55_13385 [Kiritimatiellia bacterium]|nr:hypothetical protein [Kiritimatiellia bacterium]
MTLRLASFGMRGFIGDSLSLRAVMDYTSAFATYLDGGRILLARDTRASSPMLHAAAQAALMSSGCEIHDLGICPTPLAQFATPALHAAGALSISGGHHAAGWNALTLIDSTGALIEPVGGEAILDVYHAGDFIRCDAHHMGSVRNASDLSEPYFTRLAQTVDLHAIRAANFTVLIDPVAGAGCPFLDAFAHTFGFNLVAINAQMSGYLPREAEPRPRSALPLAAFIKHVKGHVGFVLSSDMGRMSMVTETGEPVSEEMTFALLANHVLTKHPGPLATNCCTTRTIDDIAARHNVPVTKTGVGQALVVAAVLDGGCVLGGEGSGSAVLPAFSRGFDGFMMMAHILEAMALNQQTLSTLLQQLPRYHIVKRRIPSEPHRAYPLIEQLAEETIRREGPAERDLTDGIRLDWESGWMHLRASQTEQVIRILSEDHQRETAEARAERAVRWLSESR